MPQLKPFQVIVMGIFAFVAVAGLALFASFQGFNTGAPQIGSVSIWGTLPATQMKQALSAHASTRQEFIGVSYTEVAEATFDADLAEAIASGRGPDLVILTQEDLVAAQAKLSTLAANERDYRDDYLPIHELFLIPGGGAYAVPFLTDPLVLYYNRPVLASAGVAQPPATWEAVSGLAATVNRVSDTQVVSRSLVALGTYENVTNARGILSLLFLQAGLPVSERGNEGMQAAFNPPRASYGASPGESALTFYTEFANPLKTVYSWNRSLPESRDAFLAGDLALYLGFASERAELSAANPNLDFDMAAAPSPSTAGTRMTFGRAYGFAVPRASKNPNGAYQVAVSLAQPTAQASFARALGMAPTARAALAPAAGDLYEPVYYPEALIARGWLSPTPAETDAIFATMISNVTSGRETAGGALSAASQSLNAAFR